MCLQNNCKHAYLILAHNDPWQLQQLISALDDIRNDVFVHIDKKSNIEEFSNIRCEYASLKFVTDRIDVRWGHISQIEAEYRLFNCVNNHHYKRIHLLSGSDFPLKTQNEIHEFFNSHLEEEFMTIEDNCQTKNELYKKCHIYHFFLKYIKHSNTCIRYSMNLFRRFLMALQLCVKINRKFEWKELKKGSQWVSVTQSFANYLITYEGVVLSQFRYTHCCDEIYKQTIAWNSRFRHKISKTGNLRYIDFKRGTRQSPYTFRNGDYDELISVHELFARKFNRKDSGQLVERLKEYISE